MTYMRRHDLQFEKFTSARYAADVTFQEANWLSGNMNEGKLYNCGKNKLYGYKTEMYVLPNGLEMMESEN